MWQNFINLVSTCTRKHQPAPFGRYQIIYSTKRMRYNISGIQNIPVISKFQLSYIKISLNTFLKQTLSYFQLPQSKRTIPHGPGIRVEGQVVQGTERREHKLFILSCRLPSEHSQQDVYKSASILILTKKFQRLKNVLHYLLLIS